MRLRGRKARRSHVRQSRSPRLVEVKWRTSARAREEARWRTSEERWRPYLILRSKGCLCYSRPSPPQAAAARAPPPRPPQAAAARAEPVREYELPSARKGGVAQALPLATQG